MKYFNQYALIRIIILAALVLAFANYWLQVVTNTTAHVAIAILAAAYLIVLVLDFSQYRKTKKNSTPLVYKVQFVLLICFFTGLLLSYYVQSIALVAGTVSFGSALAATSIMTIFQVRKD